MAAVGKAFQLVVLTVCSLLSLTAAQESVNAREGFEVGKQAGIALVICYSTLAVFAISVNLIKKRCVKPGAGM